MQHTRFKTLGLTIFGLCTTEKELAMIERAITNKLTFTTGKERAAVKADMKRLDRLRHKIMNAETIFY